MTIFYIMFSLLGLMLIPDRNRHKSTICFVCFIILWLIQAFRASNVGCDSFYTYIPHFESQRNVDWSNVIQTTDQYKFEPGYQLFVRFIRILTHETQAFLAITSLFIIGLISIVYRRLSSNVALSFIIFSGLILYHFTFSGLRQSIAFSLTFISTIFIFKRELIPFVCLVLLAFCFHKSSIIFLPVYFLYNITISKKLIVFSIVVLCSFFASVGTVAEYVRLALFGVDKYHSYLGDNVGAFGLTILYILLTIFVLLFSDWYDKKQNFLCWMAIITLFFQPLALVSNAGDRIGYYFLIYYSLSIPNVIEQAKFTRPTNFLINLGYYICMIFLFAYCNGGGYLDVIPYSFC